MLGFEVKIVPTPDSTKAHLIARLRGDGSKKPVLLAAHADVVGVERETWTEHTLRPSPFTLLLLHSHTARGILPMGIT